MLLCPCKGQPGKDYRVTQKFGGNKQIYKQFGLEGHNGVDFAGPRPGDKIPLYSPYNGKIVKVGYGKSGFGNYVRILTDGDANGEQREFTLAHFHSINEHVKEGGYAYLGDPLGIMGNSGFSTGVHLHLQMRRLKNGKVLNYNNGYKGAIDFFPYMINSWDIVDW